MLGSLTEIDYGETRPMIPEQVVRALLSRVETGLFALDELNRVSVVNDAALDLLGVDDLEPGWPLSRLIEKAAMLTSAGRQVFSAWREAGSLGIVRLTRTDEQALTLCGSDGPHGHVVVTVAFDTRHTIPASRRDPLTGLADRVWFLERLDAMLTSGTPNVGVLMLDLDRFKAVNDTLGHQVGDSLLRLVGKRLSSTLRPADVVCRYAGDEFAIAVPNALDPMAVGRRLVSVLSRPYLIDGATASIGASVGIALGQVHGTTGSALLKAADIALYAVKGSGRGAARVFDAALDEAARKRQVLTEALRRAASLNQLELHFQPQMSLETRQLTGFEALVRWNHPEFGQLGPEDFIPLAEETGLIWSIGDWVLRQACEEATRWPLHLTVSVNISEQQMRDRNRLARTIKGVLLRTALAPARLEIEITEAALMREEETLPVLNAVQALGVRVSLDDFGTGCSSLNQLRRFPLDKIKIDRSFIHALGMTDEAAEVVKAIAALGRSMGIVTIAEGVETMDQQSRLAVDGCVEFQGFLLSKPVPAGEVAEMIRSLAGGQ